MREGRLVIGVVGPSRGMHKKSQTETGQAIIQLAKEIGAEITAQQHILLTGGEPSVRNAVRVRDVAMNSAKGAGTADRPARLISVLPRPVSQNPTAPSIEKDFDPACKRLVVQSGLGNERNFLNGRTPDVLIVVDGGSGTLSEVAFAISVGTPVVFLQQKSPPVDTWGALMSADSDDLADILTAANGKFAEFDAEELRRRVLDFVKSGRQYTALSAQDAVTRAIEVGKLKPATNSLPKHPDFDPLREKYESILTEVAK